jgi:ribokinase
MRRAWHGTHETNKTGQIFCAFLDTVRDARQNAAMSSVSDGAARVLVVGDLNPDLILRGDVVPRFEQAEQLLDTAATVIGGSAGITAHGIARLGRPVTLVAAIGCDVFGIKMTDELAVAGVDTSQLIRRTDVATGLTVVLSQGLDRAILTLPGAIPTLSVAEVRTAFADAAAAGLRHVHVCALFLQPRLIDGLAGLLSDIRASGISTSLDTNDDPSGAWTGIEPLLPHLDLLLPNRAEALAISHAVTGTPATTLIAAGRALARRGPLVIVKDGPAGASAVNTDAEIGHAPGLPADPVDATGAGDSFNAAFLDAWLSSLPIAECLRRGVTAGAHSVAGVGGTATQPTLDLLLQS